MSTHEFQYRAIGTVEEPPNLSKVTMGSDGNLRYDIQPMNKLYNADETIEMVGSYEVEDGEILHQSIFTSRYFHLVRDGRIECLGGHDERTERLVTEYLAGEMTADDLYYYPPPPKCVWLDLPAGAAADGGTRKENPCSTTTND